MSVFKKKYENAKAIVKKNDDLMAATRYAMMMRRFAATSTPVSVDFYDYAVDY